MIIYDINSWHYKLILWTWGIHFFEDSHIDWQKLENTDSTVIQKGDFELPYKYTARTVNFCPYCRALLGAAMTAPLLYLYRLFPHKESKPLTREQIKKNQKRRNRLMLLLIVTVNGGLGVRNILIGEYAGAALQFGIVVFMVLALSKSEKFGKGLVKLVDWINRHRKPKVKVKKVKVPKRPNVVTTFMKAKHDVYCPPVYFVDKSKDEEHK